MDDNTGVTVVLDIVLEMLRRVDVATHDRLELYLVPYATEPGWILRSYVLGSRCVWKVEHSLKVMWGCVLFEQEGCFEKMRGEFVNKLARWWVGWRHPTGGAWPSMHVPNSVAAGAMHNGRALFSLNT